MEKELEKYRAKCAALNLTTVVDYSAMTLAIINTLTHVVVVRPLALACATLYVL